MTDRERTDEIAKLGIELARDVVGPVPLGDLIGKARELLALAQPEPTPEKWPEKWPGDTCEPVIDCGTGTWRFHAGPKLSGGFHQIRLLFNVHTRAEAVAAWNEVVRKVRGGVDEETVRLMKEARQNMNYHGQEHRPCPACQQGVKDIDAWLAKHRGKP